LAISQDIVREFGGEMRAELCAGSCGAIFIIDLPGGNEGSK
jgi:C4-dicarboxylate-specific signal transduction histidine kinase